MPQDSLNNPSDSNGEASLQDNKYEDIVSTHALEISDKDTCNYKEH